MGAAAVVARARRQIQHEFFRNDAVSPDRAIPFDADRHVQRRVFARWRRDGVIREDRPGYFWLDVAAYDADLRRRHGRIKIALFLVIGFLLVFGLMSGLYPPHG